MRGLIDRNDQDVVGKWTFWNGANVKGTLTANQVAAGFNKNGNVYFLDPKNGSDGRDGKTPETARIGLPNAYALVEANQNDVLYYLSGSTSLSIAATFTWAKSYSHFIGVSAPTWYQNRARIFHSADMVKGITLSGSGCSFMNWYFSYGRGTNTNVKGVQVTGSRNYFENVHFCGPSHATEGAVTTFAMVELNASHQCKWVECTFGNRSISLAGAGGCVMRVDTNSSDHIFEKCRWNQLIGDAGTFMVKINDTAGAEGVWSFEDCLFVATSAGDATAMTSCFSVPATLPPCKIIISPGSQFFSAGTHDWDSNHRAKILFVAGAQAAATSGLPVITT